jgi:two-component system NtrC family sensor kinase
VKPPGKLLRKRSFSIRTKIIAAVAITLALAQLVTAILIRNIVNEYIVAQKMTTADILTTSILHDVKYVGEEGILAGSSAIVAKYMTYYRDISRMNIYDPSLTVVASSDLPIGSHSEVDATIGDAILRAKPSLTVGRPVKGSIQIRSVAPILQGSRIVGALDLEISIRDVNTTLHAIDERILVIMAVKLIVLGAILFFLLRGTILNRLERLRKVTRTLAAGRYDARVEDRQNDEIGALAEAFNTMATDLERYQHEVEEHNRVLQARVQEATAEAVKAYDDLKNTQSQLVLNEKMASLGVLIAGIAHEINTPVGAILNVSRTLDRSVRDLPRELERIRGESGVPFDTIRAGLEELVRSASQASATASYQEVRAVEGILQNAGIADYRQKASMLAKFNFTSPEHVLRYIDCFRLPSFLAFAEPLARIAQAAKISEASSQKIGEIVRALKYYAYSDKDRIEPIQVNESIQTALVLLKNQLKHSVDVKTEYEAGLGRVGCGSDIHQVWTNLLTNAVDAISEAGREGQGRIEIRTRGVGEEVVVTVTDNGPGIPPEIRGRIFDPFFTTKDIGKGTGLGLSIVAGIIKKHRGVISVESELGRTTFTVRLPLMSSAAAQREEEAA